MVIEISAHIYVNSIAKMDEVNSDRIVDVVTENDLLSMCMHSKVVHLMDEETVVKND